MNKISKNEYLGMALGLAVGFLLAAILIWSWPPAVGPEHGDAHYERYESSPYGQSAYQEVAKTWGETLSAIWERTWEDPVAFYTFVLSIFTGGLGFATVRLWFKTSDLAEGAEATAERQLRAYITFDAVTFTKVEVVDEATGKTGEACNCTLTWKNGGTTPAVNVQAWANQTIKFEAIPDDFYMVDNEDDRLEKRKSVTVVGPGGILNLTHFLDSDSIQKLRARKHYVWGWIEYDDAFAPRTPRRRTEACISLVSRTEGESIYLTHVNHAHYNAMDEGCYREIQTPRESRPPKAAKAT